MTRASILVTFLMLISSALNGQCTNPPTVVLSSAGGNTCSTVPIVISGNTFGGSATSVTISTDGTGAVSPASTSTQPFNITYTPSSGDAGLQIVITVSTDVPANSQCLPATAYYLLTVNRNPLAPVVDAVIQPTCTSSNMNILLSGLPSAGSWTLTRMPGSINTIGSGTYATVTGLAAGSYSFKVTNSEGCTSGSSSNVVIIPQPVTPAAPVVGTVTHPSCSVSTGSVVLNGLPSTGSWTLTRNPGGITTTGSGTSSLLSGISPGTHTFVVTNSSGCTSAVSLPVVFDPAPPLSATPIIGTITQPTCTAATGSVVLNGLPSTDSWIVTRNPGGSTTTGSGNSTLISDLTAGNYTFTVTNSSGCVSGVSANVNINSQPPTPSAPKLGAITQPTCAVSTGSIILQGLPSAGSWIITRNPGGVATPGSGSNTTLSDLPAGNYTFTVTNSAGCESASSGTASIIVQPGIPARPEVGTIISPTCSLKTGSVTLTGLPATGTWTLTRYPGALTSNGTGSSVTLSGIPSGIYNYTVTTASGCVSLLSVNVVIPEQPVTPSAPLIDAITQPRIDLPTGSVVIIGLPASGSWVLTLIPGNTAIPGTGNTKTVSGLNPGTYHFTVINSAGCTSVSSNAFTINALSGTPVLLITNPSPVCSPLTVDLTSSRITTGSAKNLTFSYWIDAAASIRFNTPAAAPSGTYYIKGMTTDGFSAIKPVIVTVLHKPLINAGTDQILSNQFTSTMNAQQLQTNESGLWSVISGTGTLHDPGNPKTSVSGLTLGRNVFLWYVTNGVCLPVSDTIVITVRDLPPVVPTLITPNMDGKNDYLKLTLSKSTAKMELMIFDRRGAQVYQNSNYDNSWNGVDYNGNPLQDDTYFYVARMSDGTSFTGYVVLRR